MWELEVCAHELAVVGVDNGAESPNTKRRAPWGDFACWLSLEGVSPSGKTPVSSGTWTESAVLIVCRGNCPVASRGVFNGV